MKVALFFLIILLPQASAQTIQGFLALVRQQPAVVAAQANLEAAQANLEVALDPISLETTFGYAVTELSALQLPDTNLDGQPDALPPQIRPLLPALGINPDGGTQTNTQFEVALKGRPLPYGDIADLVTQREIQLEQARIQLQETLAILETQAVEAAFNVQLTAQAITLAEEGVVLAEEAAEATAIRLERGGATDADMRQATINLMQAKAQRSSAEANHELARLALTQLVGVVILPELPEIAPIAAGVLPSVSRAELDARGAGIGVAAAQRKLLPVGQIGYSYNFNTENSLNMSLESRTLQPSLSYKYDTRGNPQLESNFTIGISFSISPGTLKAIEAAEAQERAAQAALESALDQSDLTSARIENDVDNVDSQVSIAELHFADSQLNYETTLTRVDLGLASLLERQQAFFQVQQAQLDLQARQVERLNTILASYRSYAIPLSEVLP